MNLVILFQVKKFVSEFCSVNIDQLTPDTSLANDLGIAGDDGVEFIEAFSKKFDVSMLNFNSLKYFGEEDSFNPIIYLFYRIFNKKKLALAPLNLSDLVEAIEAEKASSTENLNLWDHRF